MRFLFWHFLSPLVLISAALRSRDVQDGISNHALSCAEKMEIITRRKLIPLLCKVKEISWDFVERLLALFPINQEAHYSQQTSFILFRDCMLKSAFTWLHSRRECRSHSNLDYRYKPMEWINHTSSLWLVRAGNNQGRSEDQNCRECELGQSK